MRRAANGAAVVAVLLVYFVFATRGTLRFSLVSWRGSYYASLAEGFLHGRLAMMEQPDARLLRLRNPYDPRERGNVPVLWDASLYRGRYFLYFSPVPAVVFSIPFRVIAQVYPADELAAFALFTCAFLFSVAFLRRALRRSEPRVPMWLWIAMAGTGNVVAYVLVSVRVYEVAIAAGAAFSAAWAYSLLRYTETRSVRAALGMSVCLAMAIAARPNLVVLVAVTVAMVYRSRAALLASAIPLVIVAALLLAYNEARFGSPLEVGTTYQMTTIDMHGQHVCCLCGWPEAKRFVNSALRYMFAPLVPPMTSASGGGRLLFFPGAGERIIGVATVTPLMLIATFLVFALRPHAEDHAGRVARTLIAGAWLVLAGLSTCWWIVTRYSLDFSGMLELGTIVTVDRALVRFSGRLWRTIVIALACYSTLIGIVIAAIRLSLVR